MTMEQKIALRLQFLVRDVRKECRHLFTTDQCLFEGPFTMEQVVRLEEDPDLAECVEAFVGKFGRLQDTVGNKLLSLLLTVLGEKVSAAIDFLDWADRLGMINLLTNGPMRYLRNQMIYNTLKTQSYSAAPCKPVMFLCHHS